MCPHVHLCVEYDYQHCLSNESDSITFAIFHPFSYVSDYEGSSIANFPSNHDMQDDSLQSVRNNCLGLFIALYCGDQPEAAEGGCATCPHDRK